MPRRSACVAAADQIQGSGSQITRQIDQCLSVVADEVSQRGSIVPVEQRHIEAVRAVDGMHETGQWRVNAALQLSETVMHPAQVGVESAAGVLN